MDGELDDIVGEASGLPEPPAARQSWTASARSSVVWNAGFSVFRDVLQFGQAVVLARLIAPEAYGQFAMVTSVIGFLAMFSSRTFVSHTLQTSRDEDTRFQDHFTAGVVLQGGLFVLTNLVGAALHFSPDYAAIATPIHVMSLTFLLDWPCEIRTKMLERALDWKRRRLLHAVGLIAGMALAIVMAWLGAGVYALLVPGMLVPLPFIYDLFVREGWRPTWTWSWANYRPAAHFGLARLGGGLATTGRQLLESATLAAAYGFGPLGIFNRAIGLAQIACGKLGFQLMYAIYPILPRLDATNGQAAKAGDLILRVNSWVTVPIAVFLAVLAYPIVRVVYGSKWVEAAPLMSWAVAWVAVSSFAYVAYTLALARHRAKLCLAADVANLIGTAACLWLVLPNGFAPYLQATTAVSSVTLAALAAVLLREHALSLGGVFNATVPPAVCSLTAACLATLAVDAAGGDLNRFGPAVLWGTLFFALYTAALRLCFVRPLSELISYFPGRAAIRRVLYLGG